jgi:hypothetical protein
MCKYNWWWTSGVRDSSAWIWESTGAPITDFYWSKSMPSVDSVAYSNCIHFDYDHGWISEDCARFYFNTMCEEIKSEEGGESSEESSEEESKEQIKENRN